MKAYQAIEEAGLQERSVAHITLPSYKTDEVREVRILVLLGERRLGVTRIRNEPTGLDPAQPSANTNHMVSVRGQASARVQVGSPKSKAVAPSATFNQG